MPTLGRANASKMRWFPLLDSAHARVSARVHSWIVSAHARSFTIVSTLGSCLRSLFYDSLDFWLVPTLAFCNSVHEVVIVVVIIFVIAFVIAFVITFVIAFVITICDRNCDSFCDSKFGPDQLHYSIHVRIRSNFSVHVYAQVPR